MAEAHGIDIDNPRNIVEQTISFGIKDYNPERVLKNCKYLYVTGHGSSLVAKLFQLPTAGKKKLLCTRHKHALVGESLDMIYAEFESNYCRNCVDKLPHPQNWKWTFEWQQEEDRRFRYPATT